MSENTPAFEVPEDWDDLTDAEKDEVSGELLKRIADDTGVDRGSEAETAGEEGRSRPPRTFQRPSDDS